MSTGLSALDDPSPAAWLHDGLADTPFPVGRVVTPEFAAYALVALPEDEEGTIDEATCSALIRILTPFTPDPRHCYFAIWVGYAGFDDLPGGTIFVPPNRELLIFAGALQDAALSPEPSPGDRRPNRWWPAGHQWCIGSDIYGRTLVVAGSSECVAAIVQEPALRARTLDPSERVPLL